MKRLIKKRVSLAHMAFNRIRRKRLVFAEWVPGDINDPNLVQQVTDIMASGGQMQIEYNGEWKTIEPYGWNSSKAGNVLLMCYKDTGEVRSYRLDRITDVQFDTDVLDLSQYGLDPESENAEEIDGVEVPSIDDGTNDYSFEDVDKEVETPFDGAIDVLEQVDDEYMIEDLRQVDNQEFTDLEEFEPASIDDYDVTNEQDQQII